MKHLQTYELSRQEHADLKLAPFLLIVPPSPVPQEITLTVEAPRRTLTMSPNGKPLGRPKKATQALACQECGATTTAHGEPFKNSASVAKHRYKAHGQRTKKAGAK